MQIQEVSNRTGLTKRTIRFYIEKELIDPEVVERNGKEYREYSEKDIRELTSIAGLRKALFSIEQIKVMLDQPSEIPSVLVEYRQGLIESHKNLTRLLEIMEEFQADTVANIYELSDSVSEVSDEMKLPPLDITPHFGRFDAEYDAAANKQPQKARYFSRAFAVFITAVLVITSLTSTVSWFNRSQHPKFAGESYFISSKSDHSIEFRNNGGKTILVTSQDKIYQNFGRLMITRAYSTYDIDVINIDGSEESYAYHPTISDEIWIVGKYDLYGFTLPAHFVVRGETTVVKNYEVISLDVKFIIDCITAYRNYMPFSKAVTPVYIAIPAGCVLWFLAILWWNNRKNKWVISIPNLTNSI